jgi:hypothetical protein
VRKALLVIALIAAAFAGGAMVNGPGLAWAQKQIANRFGGGPVDLENDEVVKPGDDLPRADDNPVGSLATAGGTPTASKGIAATSEPQPSLIPALDPQAGAPAPPSEPKPIGATDAKSIAVSTAPAPADLALPPSSPTMGEPAKGGKDKAQDRESPWSDAPGSAPAKAILPERFPTEPNTRIVAEKNPAGARDLSTKAVSLPTLPPDSGPPMASPASAISPSKEWADLRRRMREVGISRYWIEAEPAGAVRFRCIIPLAGTRAVAQQFEAEGDDEFQAADAALRRVALWRATEQ